MTSPSFSLLRLRVVSEAEPGALVRVLQQFQNLNFVPRRVVAECSTVGVFHVSVDIFGMTEERMTLVTAKINEMTCVHNAYWCHA
jgi:hypothetical protein